MGLERSLIPFRPDRWNILPTRRVCDIHLLDPSRPSGLETGRISSLRTNFLHSNVFDCCTGPKTPYPIQGFILCTLPVSTSEKNSSHLIQSPSAPPPPSHLPSLLRGPNSAFFTALYVISGAAILVNFLSGLVADLLEARFDTCGPPCGPACEHQRHSSRSQIKSKASNKSETGSFSCSLQTISPRSVQRLPLRWDVEDVEDRRRRGEGEAGGAALARGVLTAAPLVLWWVLGITFGRVHEGRADRGTPRHWVTWV